MIPRYQIETHLILTEPILDHEFKTNTTTFVDFVIKKNTY